MEKVIKEFFWWDMSCRPYLDILRDNDEYFDRFFRSEKHMQADAPVHMEEIYQFCDSHIEEDKPLRRFRISIQIEEIDENGVSGLRGAQPIPVYVCPECSANGGQKDDCPKCDADYPGIFERREERLAEFEDESE